MPCGGEGKHLQVSWVLKPTAQAPAAGGFRLRRKLQQQTTENTGFTQMRSGFTQDEIMPSRVFSPSRDEEYAREGISSGTKGRRFIHFHFSLWGFEQIGAQNPRRENGNRKKNSAGAGRNSASANSKIISAAVGEGVEESLDLKALTKVYEREERGYPPYQPVMMTKVLLYAYCMGLPSSRKIGECLMEDVG